MGTQQRVASLVVSQLALGAVRAVGGDAAASGVEAVSSFLARQLGDPSNRLLRALERANENAWRALEIALAGDSFLDRCKAVLAGGDYRSFRDRVREFLGGLPEGWAGPGSTAALRERALRDLRAARKAGLMERGALDPQELTARAGQLARFTDPAALLAAERQAVATLADDLAAQGYRVLARLLVPPQGPPLLAVAARYFFRREVEADAELFRGLAWSRLEGLGEAQEQGLAGLAEALDRHGEQLAAALEEVREVVVQTHADVLDVKQEVQKHGRQLQELAQAVLGALGQRQLERREVRAGDSLSMANESERHFVKELVSRFRALPEGQRRQMPAMLNALGKLEVMAGDFEGAQRDFQEAAGLVDDSLARAEIYHNAYRTALERRDWAAALRELIGAVKIDARRFAPFPMGKYQPQRIVGAGGFGVAFLCKHKFTGASVLVKTLSSDGLDRGIDAVFTEARALQQLDHPSIIRLHDCGFTDPSAKARPYLMMEYFDGTTLEQYVEQNGPLPPADALAVAQRLAQALEAAHGKGILHRDVKPSNLLLRKDTQPDGTMAWAVKVIDFGLALRQDRTAGSSTARNTLLGASIAGTRDYAAPEQMGKRPDTPIGPQADVYGFARTCCFALFGTPQPLPRHWKRLPTALTRLLEDCLEEDPQRRPRSCMALCKRLASVAATVTGSAGPIPVTPVAITTAPAVPVARSSSAIRPAPREVRRERRYALETEDDHRARAQRLFWIAGGIAAGFALLMIVLIIVLLRRDRRTPEAPPVVAQRSSTIGSKPMAAWQAPAGAPEARRSVPEAAKPTPEVALPHRAAVPGSRVLTPEEAAGQALADLQSDAAARRRAALLRLARLRGVVEREDVAPAAAKLLPDPDKSVRQAAARAVGAWGGSESVKALAKLLKDPDASVRLAAIAALGHLKTEKAAEPLMQHLMVEFEPSLEALRELGPLAEPAAMARLKDSDHKVQVEACKVLIYVFTVKSGPDLRALSRDSRDRDLQALALMALKHDQAVVAALAELTRNDGFGHFDRIKGAKMLANLAPNARRAQVASALVSQLGQEDVFLNREIPMALAQWGTPEVVPSLIQMVNRDDRSSELSKAATIALGRLKDPRAVDAIVPRLTKGVLFFDQSAQQALVSLGEVAEWPLQKHLNDPDPSIRAAVCEVLAKIGTDDSIPGLEALRTDSESQVASAANRAIEAINRRMQ